MDCGNRAGRYRRRRPARPPPTDRRARNRRAERPRPARKIASRRPAPVSPRPKNRCRARPAVGRQRRFSNCSAGPGAAPRRPAGPVRGTPRTCPADSTRSAAGRRPGTASGTGGRRTGTWRTCCAPCRGGRRRAPSPVWA